MSFFTMPFKNNDRRGAPRTPISETLFIESVSSAQISQMEPSTANAINISANGMQVELDFPVLEESEIALWINADDGTRTLVGGIVRWVEEKAENLYTVGIELDDESVPAVAPWLKPS